MGDFSLEQWHSSHGLEMGMGPDCKIQPAGRAWGVPCCFQGCFSWEWSVRVERWALGGVVFFQSTIVAGVPE